MNRTICNLFLGNGTLNFAIKNILVKCSCCLSGLGIFLEKLWEKFKGTIAGLDPLNPPWRESILKCSEQNV